jgi:excisionase family DNA binding protein
VIPDPHEQPLLSAERARLAVGAPISKSSWYAAIARGEIPARRVGGRWLVSTAELIKWAGLEPNGDGVEPPPN